MSTNVEKKGRDWQLVSKIIAHSKGSTWEEAKNEWETIDYYEDPDSTCVCGKEHITHCHTIKNTETNDVVGPIGSSCIEKFDSATMNNDASLSRVYVQLDKAFDSFVEMDDIRTLLRNRKLLQDLSDKNVFKDKKQGEFYGKMIRKTTPGSEKQENYLKSLVYFTVKPYIQDKIKDYRTHEATPDHPQQLKDYDDITRSHILALGHEFNQPTTTLGRLYGHLSQPKTIDYLKGREVFQNETTETFFVDMMGKIKNPSDKQRDWLRKIISEQIKPVILEDVKEFYAALSLSDDDLDLKDDAIEL